jgi:predicted nucleotidyltransferase
MNRSAIIDILRRHQAEFKALGVAHLSLFGSVARDEAGEQSDIDVILDRPDGEAFSFFEMSDIMDVVARILNRRADIISKCGLKFAPRFNRRIEKDIVHVF